MKKEMNLYLKPSEVKMITKEMVRGLKKTHKGQTITLVEWTENYTDPKIYEVLNGLNEINKTIWRGLGLMKKRSIFFDEIIKEITEEYKNKKLITTFYGVPINKLSKKELIAVIYWLDKNQKDETRSFINFRWGPEGLK